MKRPTETVTSGQNQTPLSVEEAARILGVARATLYETIRTNPTFPVLKLGQNRLLIPRRAFQEWVETGGVTPGVDAAAIGREVCRAALQAQITGLQAQLDVLRRELESIGNEGG